MGKGTTRKMKRKPPDSPRQQADDLVSDGTPRPRRGRPRNNIARDGFERLGGLDG